MLRLTRQKTCYYCRAVRDAETIEKHITCVYKPDSKRCPTCVHGVLQPDHYKNIGKRNFIRFWQYECKLKNEKILYPFNESYDYPACPDHVLRTKPQTRKHINVAKEAMISILDLLTKIRKQINKKPPINEYYSQWVEVSEYIGTIGEKIFTTDIEVKDSYSDEEKDKIAVWKNACLMTAYIGFRFLKQFQGMVEHWRDVDVSLDPETNAEVRKNRIVYLNTVNRVMKILEEERVNYSE